MEIIFTLSPLSHFLIYLKEIISSFLYGYGQLKTNEIGCKLWVEGISIRCLGMNNNTAAGRLFLDSKCTHNLMRVTPHQSRRGLGAAAAVAVTEFFLLFRGFYGRLLGFFFRPASFFFVLTRR